MEVRRATGDATKMEYSTSSTGKITVDLVLFTVSK